jgi:hypothetical protein
MIRELAEGIADVVAPELFVPDGEGEGERSF